MAVCIAVIGKDVSRGFYSFEVIIESEGITKLRGTIITVNKSVSTTDIFNKLNVFIQNSPKYIKCADESLALQFHCKVHTSIDVIEEKLNVGNKTAVDIRDLYLGLLHTTEEYKMYALYIFSFTLLFRRNKI